MTHCEWMVDLQDDTYHIDTSNDQEPLCMFDRVYDAPQIHSTPWLGVPFRNGDYEYLRYGRQKRPERR